MMKSFACFSRRYGRDIVGTSYHTINLIYDDVQAELLLLCRDVDCLFLGGGGGGGGSVSGTLVWCTRHDF